MALRQLLFAPDERSAADCVVVQSALSPAVSVREGVLEDGRDAPSDGRSDERSDGRNTHSQ